MRKHITVDVSNAAQFVSPESLAEIKEEVLAAKKTLLEGTAPGNDFLGWVDLPENYDKEEFARIKEAAKKIQSDSEILVVIGIGGSYLGARAVIEALGHSFSQALSPEKRKGVQVYFTGNNMSGTYISDLIDVLDGKDFSINVISKSGTTTEPAVSFRVFRNLLEEKYGKEEAGKRIYATTDRAKGALKTLADREGWETYVVPDDIGGRYSVLTAVGLLPIAAAGFDIDELMQGAADERKALLETEYEENAALTYAAARNIMMRSGKEVEILANYEPGLHYVAEWWKQLYGESEGKGGNGIFPASVDFTTDLHSMGQFIQDGSRILMETVINVEAPGREIILPEAEEDLDGLNYIAGKTFDYINRQAMKGTVMAHVEGGTPNMIVNLPKLNEYHLAQLLYFFEFACGVSGYMLGVNPFNQPGVEFYKKNMFMLLGKPGYTK